MRSRPRFVPIDDGAKKLRVAQRARLLERAMERACAAEETLAAALAKLTLKQRIEDHRDDPACYSCHTKIDPWGIAFENFDALGQWRDKIDGQPVDASSRLFNKDELHGINGLKDYLLANRQNQFARAMTHKLAAYALGRPLTFGDRSQVDSITVDLRKQGDGLADLVFLIVKSDLFQLN